MKPNIVYPCPADRPLSDAELNRIAAQGWYDYKRENPKTDEGEWWKE